VLSSDVQNDADVFAMNGAAVALFVSNLPFRGPIASCRVGRVDSKLIAFPTVAQLEESELDMIVSANEREVVMIEGFAQEMPEAEMIEAIKFAHDICRQVIELQRVCMLRFSQSRWTVRSPDDSELCPNAPKNTTIDSRLPSKPRASKLAMRPPTPKSRSFGEMIPDPAAEGAVRSISSIAYGIDLKTLSFAI
jgi:polyribonucleotide nucleotidyltransferase